MSDAEIWHDQRERERESYLQPRLFLHDADGRSINADVSQNGKTMGGGGEGGGKICPLSDLRLSPSISWRALPWSSLRTYACVGIVSADCYYLVFMPFVQNEQWT